MQIYKFRDLTIIDKGKKEKIVIACDSCCGIGEMKDDIVSTSNEIVGYFSARVCLFELLSFGSYPSVIINNLGMPMKKYGEKIIKGINKAIDEYNQAGFFNSFNLKQSITGSTEDNFKTLQTFVGLTIIGEKLNKSKNEIKSGDFIYLLGVPKVGVEVLNDINSENSEIVTFKELKVLLDSEVNEILPIGSKGAYYELQEIEKSKNIKIKLEYNNNILNKSAGPSTALVFICNEEKAKSLNSKITIPMTKLGVVY